MLAVVPPSRAAMPVAQTVPVPSTREMFCAVAETIIIPQMCSLLVEVIRSVEAVWLIGFIEVQTVDGLGDGATTRAVSVVAAFVPEALTGCVVVPSQGWTLGALATVRRGVPVPEAP